MNQRSEAVIVVAILCRKAFAAAHIQMSYPIEAAIARAALDASRPNLMAFIDRIRGRPAYRRAVERAGGYMALR
jgi:glutathione S-transferase